MIARLQKVIANSGLTSRRKAERLISEGKVTVNGTIVTRLGTQVDPEKDVIGVTGKTLSLPSKKTVVYALYKPRYCVTTLDDPQGRDTVVKYFPKTNFRLFPVGRLDYDAEGLILLTNDGELAHNITHPSKHIWKQYFVKIKGKLVKQEIRSLVSGPVINGIKRQTVKIKLLHYVNDKTWLVVSLQEGTKHHLKKMFDTIGYPVLKIKRYSIGNIELLEMKPGDCKLLSKSDVQKMLDLVKNN